ncbi:hypothetical protein [Enterococcus sp. DIV0187]|uniref:hypothetical protein n=1 Tax=Enterococcus sp. DIV0187 TaxID=2774644 RepID=UPI003F27730B
MGYEELIGILYDMAKETDDEVLQERLYDLGWTVKKCGIRDESEDPDEEIHFADLLKRLGSIADQAENRSDKIAVTDLKNTLSSNGIDGYFGNF